MRIIHPSLAGSARLSGIAWDGYAWVAVGGGSTILRSADGIEWERQDANAKVCFRNRQRKVAGADILQHGPCLEGGRCPAQLTMQNLKI